MVLMVLIEAEDGIGGEAGGFDLTGSADDGLRLISIQMVPDRSPKSLGNRLGLVFLLKLASL